MDRSAWLGRRRTRHIANGEGASFGRGRARLWGVACKLAAMPAERPHDLPLSDRPPDRSALGEIRQRLALVRRKPTVSRSHGPTPSSLTEDCGDASESRNLQSKHVLNILHDVGADDDI